MFRIAKSIVKTFEQSVSETIGAGEQLDSYFGSIPPNLLVEGNSSNESLHGLRVLSCAEFQLQLQSFFDYIVGINDQPIPLIQNQHGYLYPDYNTILSLLNQACGSSVKLNVWSGKGGFYRDEYMQVSRKSSLEDVPLDSMGERVLQEFEPLGFTVQWTPLIAVTYTYHVLQIHETTSPAARAGLIPQEDYIIGCQDGLLATGGESLLQDIVRSRANQELVLYVFNLVGDCVRPITVRIGGDGRLGCGVGYGYLHRIPVPQTIAANMAGKPTFAAEVPSIGATPSSDAFVPAQAANVIPVQPDLPTSTTSTFIAPPPVHKKKARHGHAAASSMQDYFQEGKDQSPSPASKATPPPPPPVKS
ncbi:LAFE_0G01024g1_1 [Lachancea fermentati]|uniref:LAFE_0G01024g1_1 n=1 Tax=Lachancea fermentati TaxID=4955 RepID=A0A1G4MGH6_LACFM|nr:LAFE_0G01024g1_1 [Lachancea fermentati]